MEVKEVYAYLTTNDSTKVSQSGISLLPWTYKEINVPVTFTNFKEGTISKPQLYGGTSIENFLTMFIINKNIFQGDIYKSGNYDGTWNGNKSLASTGELSLGFIPKIIFIEDDLSGGAQGVLFPQLGIGLTVFKNSNTLLKVTYSSNAIYWQLLSNNPLREKSLNLEDHTYYYIAMG